MVFGLIIIIITYFLPRGKFSFQLKPTDSVLPTKEYEGRGVEDIAGIVPATTRASGSLGRAGSLTAQLWLK